MLSTQLIMLLNLISLMFTHTLMTRSSTSHLNQMVLLLRWMLLTLQLQACIRDIRTWMVQDKLQLNDSKTKFLIIGTRAQLNKVTINDLQVGEVKVSAVHSVRNLGAWFDTNMNMTTHINSICQSIYYHLHNIRRIRKYLSYDNRK